MKLVTLGSECRNSVRFVIKRFVIVFTIDPLSASSESDSSRGSPLNSASGVRITANNSPPPTGMEQRWSLLRSGSGSMLLTHQRACPYYTMWSTRRPRGFELDRVGFVGHVSQVLELRVRQSSLVGRTIILAKSKNCICQCQWLTRNSGARRGRPLPVWASVMTVPCSYAPLAGCINLNWDHDSQPLVPQCEPGHRQ